MTPELPTPWMLNSSCSFTQATLAQTRSTNTFALPVRFGSDWRAEVLRQALPHFVQAASKLRQHGHRTAPPVQHLQEYTLPSQHISLFQGFLTQMK